MDDPERIPLREFIERVADERWQSHLREHQVAAAARDAAETQHRIAHEREHAMTATAITKAEDAVNRALVAAKEANDKRFDAGNEFRAALGDAAARFATRDTMAALEKSLIERQERVEKELSRRLTELERGASNMSGRLWALGVVFALLVVAVQIAAKLW